MSEISADSEHAATPTRAILCDEGKTKNWRDVVEKSSTLRRTVSGNLPPPLPPNICFPEITSEDICSLLTVMVMASIQGYVRDNISGAQNVLHSCQPTLSRCLPTGFRDTPRPEIKRHWLPDEWRHLRLVFPAYGDRTVVCASCNFSHAYAKSWGANRIRIIESGKAPLDISCSVIQQQGPSIYCSISRA